MSRGPGSIEKRISALFAATRDRALSIDEITDRAFALRGRAPTRAQRLSATRAAHRLLRRVREADDRADKLISKAHANTQAALGRERLGVVDDKQYDARLEADPAMIEGWRLYKFSEHIGVWHRFVPLDKGRVRSEVDHWCTTTIKGRLYFHPPDVPMCVWAVSIGPGGITWADADVTKVTARNVMVRYAGEIARLNRQRLWHWWSWWRAVMFVSSRTGRIAAALDELWHKRYHAAGGVPPSMQMPLAEAMALLGVPINYTKEDVLAAFRRKAKEAHPDAGGTAEMFRALVEARDRLLAAIGTSAPPPKPPSYAPKGTAIVYRRLVSGRKRLGYTRHLPR